MIEDEPSLAQVLEENLIDEGYVVEAVGDGLLGLERWREHKPQIVVLDVMLPSLDGYEICRRQRAAGDTTPVLFLSARGQPGERVTGLEAGGDDYLTKPFHLPEFLLRVKALLRRSQGADLEELHFAGHAVDLRRWCAVLADGREVRLSERELGILRLLVERGGEVVSRDEIMDRVWGDGTFPSTRTVDNFIVRLRRLFEPDPSAPVHFHTIWGVGYRFTAEPEREIQPASSASQNDQATARRSHALAPTTNNEENR